VFERRVLQERIEVLPPRNQVDVHGPHVAAVDEAQIGVARRRNEVVLAAAALAISETISLDVPAYLGFTLTAGLCLERLDPFRIGVILQTMMLTLPSPLPMSGAPACPWSGMVRPLVPDEFDGVPVLELLPHAVSVNAKAAISMVAAFQPRILELGCIRFLLRRSVAPISYA